MYSTLSGDVPDPTAGMSAAEKKFYELQQRLKVSRKANQTAALAERKRKQAPMGSAEATEKRKWFEEKQRRKKNELERLGLDEKDVRLLSEVFKHRDEDTLLAQQIQM